jgi:hypothetical protein
MIAEAGPLSNTLYNTPAKIQIETKHIRKCKHGLLTKV